MNLSSSEESSWESPLSYDCKHTDSCAWGLNTKNSVRSHLGFWSTGWVGCSATLTFLFIYSFFKMTSCCSNWFSIQADYCLTTVHGLHIWWWNKKILGISKVLNRPTQNPPSFAIMAFMSNHGEEGALLCRTKFLIKLNYHHQLTRLKGLSHE